MRTAIEQRLSGALDNLSEHRRRRRGGPQRHRCNSGLRSVRELAGRGDGKSATTRALLRGDCRPSSPTPLSPRAKSPSTAAAVGRGVEECGRAGWTCRSMRRSRRSIPERSTGRGSRTLDRPRLRATSGLRADHGDGRRHPRRYQAAVRTFDRLVWLLVVITILLMVAAVLVAVRRLPHDRLGRPRRGGGVAPDRPLHPVGGEQDPRGVYPPRGQAAASAILDQLVGSAARGSLSQSCLR